MEAWNTILYRLLETNASSPLMFKRLLSTWDLSPFLVGETLLGITHTAHLTLVLLSIIFS